MRRASSGEDCACAKTSVTKSISFWTWMVTMRVCLPLPRRRFCSDRLERHLSEKARQCPLLSLRACAYLLSLLGTCLLARAEPCETLFELAEHLLQLDELA